MAIAGLGMLSTGCMTAALRESARIRETPGRIESVAFFPNGEVQIAYPVSLSRSQFKPFSLYGATPRPFDPPRTVYRVAVLRQEAMEKRNVSWNDRLTSYINHGTGMGSLHLWKDGPRQIYERCEGSFLPAGLTLGGYTLEAAQEVCNAGGRSPRTAEVMRRMVDHRLCRAEGRDTSKESARLREEFQVELEAAMASSEFIYRKRMSYWRPHGADPVAIPPKQHERHANDYLVKLNSGTWARFSLPNRSGIPVENQWVGTLTPLTTVIDIVFFPVELPFVFLAAGIAGAGIPH